MKYLTDLLFIYRELLELMQEEELLTHLNLRGLGENIQPQSS